MSRTLQIDPDKPDDSKIREVVSALRQGAITAYPTETFYGLGVDVTNEYAIKRLFDLKRRDYGNPIAIIVADRGMLQEVVSEIPPHAENLMKKYWPGPLTILFPASDLISKTLTTNTGKIGIRISSHPIAQAMTQTLGKPLTTTSANLTGFPPSYEPKHIQSYFGDKLDLIVDAGTLYASRGSTVVDVSEDKLVVIREGDIAADDIFEIFHNEETDD